MLQQLQQTYKAKDEIIFDIIPLGEDKSLSYGYNSIGNMLNLTFNDYNISYVYDDVKIHAVVEMNTSLIMPSDNDRFEVEDSVGGVVGWLGSEGNIVLSGGCFVSESCEGFGDNSFIIQNSSGSNVSYINSSGDMCLSSGSCEDYVESCNPAVDSFIVRNSSNYNMSYLDVSGELCLVGGLIEGVDSNGVRSEVYVYDGNGNMVRNSDREYVYDGFNRLMSISDRGSLVSEYWYDDGGERVRKTEYGLEGENVTTYYVGDSLVRVVNSSGSYDSVYYYADGVLVGANDSGVISYYHPDHLGSTSLISNSSGEVVSESWYMPFGSLVDGEESRFGYTGQENEGDDLMYYGARYYDSELRHFVQADVVIGDVYNPQDLNHYAYVRGNPYRYVDESGESVTELNLASKTFITMPFGTYTLKKWRGNLNKDSLSLVGEVGVKAYDIFVKPEIDVLYWSYEETDDSILETIPDYSSPTNSEMAEIRGDAIYGSVSIWLTVGTGVNLGGEAMKWFARADILSSIVTDKNFAEQTHNVIKKASSWLDKALDKLKGGHKDD